MPIRRQGQSNNREPSTRYKQAKIALELYLINEAGFSIFQLSLNQGDHMASITLKGNPVSTVGTLPATGSVAPAFSGVKTDLSVCSLADLSGKKVVLNIFPSIDTGVCAASTRRFNQEAAALENTVVVCVSADLPFALGRFCGAEGLTNVVPVSIFRNPEFGKNYGATIADGPLVGLLSRAVVVIDESGKVIYTEQVPEITQEPNYDAALAAL
jgi:thiol peroxidase